MPANDDAKLLVDSSDRNADLRYACPFQTTGDAVVCLIRAGKRWLVVPAMERARAEQETAAVGGTTVLTPAALNLEPADRRRVSAWVLALLRRTKIAQVTVGRDFPLAVADALRAQNIGVHPVADRLFPAREIKRADELQACRESQRAAVAAMRAAIQLLRMATPDTRGRLWHAGRLLTSERVRYAMECVMLARRCHGADTIVACGAHSALPHHRGKGPLWAGRPIIIDVFPGHLRHGYHGDLTRTLVKGPVPVRLQRMLSAVRMAHREALSCVRAGVSAGTVHGAAQAVFERLGMQTDLQRQSGFIHATGHGVGLDIHEPPWVGGSRQRLRVGQVITVEPGWYEPGFGGVRIEDTVAVTATGYTMLARCAVAPNLQ